MIGRALLVIVMVGVTAHPARAQSGETPIACRELLAMRDELRKHGQAIEAANKKRPDAVVACRLFRRYIATEAKMLKALDENGRSCGAPAHVGEQVRASHAKAQQIGKKICDVARDPPFHHDPPLNYEELRLFKLSNPLRP